MKVHEGERAIRETSGASFGGSGFGTSNTCIQVDGLF